MPVNEVVLDKEAVRQSIRARKGVDRALLEAELAREYGLTPEEVVAVLLELELEERGARQADDRARTRRHRRPRSKKAYPA